MFVLTKGNQHNQVSPFFVETQLSRHQLRSGRQSARVAARVGARAPAAARRGALLYHSRDPRKEENSRNEIEIW